MTGATASQGVVRRIFGNLAHLLTGKAAAGLLSLVFLAIAARILGPADFGTLALINGYTLAIGGVVNFPAWHAVVRYGAPAILSGDTGRLMRLMRFTATLELCAGAIAVLVAVFAAPLIGPRLGLDSEAQRLVAPYALAVLATVRTTPAGLLQLLRRFDLLGLHALVNPMVRLVGTIVACACGFGLTGFVYAWLASALAECASMWALGYWCLRRSVPMERTSGGPSGASAENPGLLRFLVFANVDTTLSDLSPRVALLLVGSILGPAAAGLFSVAQRATVVLAQPAAILGQAAYAELAHLIAEGARGSLLRRTVAECIGGAMTLASPIVILVVLFPDVLVKMVAGDAFSSASVVAVWLMLARTVRLAGPPTSAVLIALGRPSFSVAANAISATLLPAAVVLMRTHGLSGAGMFALLEAGVAVTLLLAFALFVSGSGSPPRVRCSQGDHPEAPALLLSRGTGP